MDSAVYSQYKVMFGRHNHAFKKYQQKEADIVDTGSIRLRYTFHTPFESAPLIPDPDLFLCASKKRSIHFWKP